MVMSSTSKSKSKEKMVSKEAQKSFAMPSGSGNAVPEAVNDKQEKIRQKNERKHQLRKERQAQELHDLCSAYLISRKLEALAQQLVAMGFSHERATMALILNEGKVEESVAWLFESGGEEDNHRDKKNIDEGNLKIDISEELARIVDLQTRFNCSKQEVERRVVACEGDLDKAAETLQELKSDPPYAQPKQVENADLPSIDNNKQPSAISQSLESQAKPLLSPNQPKKDLNSVNTAVMAGKPFESSRRNVQPLNRKSQKAGILCDKSCPSVGSNPSVSYSLASPLQKSPTTPKSEVIGCDYMNLQTMATRESTIMMQQPQTVNAKLVPRTTMSSYPQRVSTSWYPTNCVEVMRPNNVLSHSTSTRNSGSNHIDSNQLYHKHQYQPQQQFWVGNNHPLDLHQGDNMWNKTSASPTLVVASSIGLSSGLGSIATSDATSPIFWSIDGSMHFDYTNIDWSLDRGISSQRSNALCLGLSPFTRTKAQLYNSNASGMVSQPSMRSFPSNGSIVPLPGLQDGGVSST